MATADTIRSLARPRGTLCAGALLLPCLAAAQALYPIGQLPAGVRINWPAAPVITRTVDAVDAAGLQQQAAVAGSRIRVTAGIGSSVSINASDIEVLLNPGVRVEGLRLGHGIKRVRIAGGVVGSVDFPEPVDFNNGNRVHPEWVVEDVVVDSVQFCNTDRSGTEIRGRRVAILRSRAEVQRYCVWCGSISGIPNEDIIIAGNFFFSKGTTANEATVRLVGVQRSVTVDNVLINSSADMVVMPAGSNSKHCYRIHGVSGGNFAARNVLVNSGVMIGTMAGDAVDSIWFNDNTFYHVSSDLFNLNDAVITYAQIRTNAIHTNVWNCFYCRTPPSGWDVAGNQLDAYQRPPQDIVTYGESACGSLAVREPARSAMGAGCPAAAAPAGARLVTDCRGRVVAPGSDGRALSAGVYFAAGQAGPAAAWTALSGR